MSDEELIRRGDVLRRIAASEDGAIGAWEIAALPAVTVRVKPLVWEDFGDWGAKASAYYQANYLIQFWKGREQFEVALSYPGYQTGFDGDRWHHTLDAAKAAAQADYEARILAALEPVTQPDPADEYPYDAVEQCERDLDGIDPAAIREAALREAAAVCEYVIKNIDILKADGETYETPRVQKIARGLVDVARQDILALIPKGAADDRA